MEINGSVYIILQRIWGKFPKPAIFLELRDAVESNVDFLTPGDRDAIEENDIKASTRIVLQTVSRLEEVEWISVNRENSFIRSVCLLPSGRVAFEHYLQRQAWATRYERPCKTEGCARKVFRRGYCGTCYKTNIDNSTVNSTVNRTVNSTVYERETKNGTLDRCYFAKRRVS